MVNNKLVNKVTKNKLQCRLFLYTSQKKPRNIISVSMIIIVILTIISGEATERPCLETLVRSAPAHLRLYLRLGQRQ